MEKQNSKENREFVVRSYSKSELAWLYFPTASSTHVATNHLMSWIKRCRPLMDTLMAAHYNRNSKWFSPRQVEAIVQYLGCP